MSKVVGAKNKKENRQGLVLVLVLVVIAVAGFFVVQSVFGDSEGTRMVNVPDIETHLISADGTRHMFGARVVLELDNNAPNVRGGDLHGEVLAAINALSYEDITGFYGMDMVRDAIRARLGDTFADEELVGIFFSSMVNDMSLPRVERPRQNAAFEAFFGGGN